MIAWVAALGIVINSITAFLFFRQRQELNSRAAYLHLLADALVSVGVVIAGVIISYTHWYWLDAAIGLVIMVVILVSTWGLLRDSFRISVNAVCYSFLRNFFGPRLHGIGLSSLPRSFQMLVFIAAWQVDYLSRFSSEFVDGFYLPAPAIQGGY